MEENIAHSQINAFFNLKDEANVQTMNFELTDDKVTLRRQFGVKRLVIELSKDPIDFFRSFNTTQSYRYKAVMNGVVVTSVPLWGKEAIVVANELEKIVNAIKNDKKITESEDFVRLYDRFKV